MTKPHPRVLIVDDDEAIVESLRIILTMEGFVVATTTRGDLVIHEVQAINPDLIILDIFLAGQDGRQIAQDLKASRSTGHIPIIMISAHPAMEESVKQAGIDEFMPKPFDVTELISTIHRCVDG